MARRTVATIKQYDYTSKAEFLKHVKEMREKGYRLIEKDDYGWSQAFGHDEVDDEVWHYTACFLKSDMA